MELPVEPLTRLGTAFRTLDRSLILGQDGAGAAAALRELVPDAPLVVAELGSPRRFLAVLDDRGQRRRDWEAVLQEQYTSNPGGEGPLLEDLGLSEHVLVREPLPSEEAGGGSLGVAVGKQTSPQERTFVRTLVALLAGHLDGRLRLRRAEERQDLWRAEAEALARMADVAELSGPLHHQVNNYLNTVLLQIAVLEQVLPREQAGDLAELRRSGRKLAEQVRYVQRYRRRASAGPHVTDLNDGVRLALTAFEQASASMGRPVVRGLAGSRADGVSAGTWQVIAELSREPLPVPACQADLQRLCGLLLNQAGAAVGAAGGVIEVRTERGAGATVLQVRDWGPGVGETELHYLFDAGRETRVGTSPLEMAAIKSLAQRLEASIGAESPNGQGLCVTVKLPAGAGASGT